MADFRIGDAPKAGAQTQTQRFRIGDAPDPAPQQPLSSGQQFLKNVGTSAYNAAAGFVTPFIHPIKTAEAFGKTALGEAGKVRDLVYGDEAPAMQAEAAKQYPSLASFDAETKTYAGAMNHYFTSRYGSIDGFKKAVYNDPVGVVSDISMFASLGGEGLARAPGLAGKVGEYVKAAGTYSNPVSVAGKAGGKVASFGGSVLGHVATHAGGPTLKLAEESGKLGREASKAFMSHMTGKASLREIVSTAKTAVGHLRTERKAAYRAGMQQVSQDATVLSFDPLDKEMMATDEIGHYKNQDLYPETAEIRKKVKDKIEYWKSLPPGEFHTPEGFDALKKTIGSARDATAHGSPEWVVANNAYHAINDTITKQAPVYAKVMKDYEDASEQIREMEHTLSLKSDATVDTTARKLLSMLRDNMNTNYGRRAELGKILAAHGAPNLPYMLAGEASRSWAPRGLGSAEAGAPMIAAWALHRPELLGLLPFMSPRLMGNVAHAIGRANPAFKQAPLASQVARVLGPGMVEQQEGFGWGTAQDIASYLGVPITTEADQQSQTQ